MSNKVRKLVEFSTAVDRANRELISFLGALINRTEDKTIIINFSEFEPTKGKKFNVEINDETVCLKLL